MARENPFKPEDEIRHQSYEHGYNSNNKTDCPYEKGTLEADVALPAWDRGFRDGQKDRKKNTSVEEKSTPNRETEHKVVGSSIESATDDVLMAELKRRKTKEYNELLEMRAEVDKQLERLRFLFND